MLAPHFSTMSIAQYADRTVTAAGGRVPVDVVRSWHLEPGYLDLLTGCLADAIERVGGAAGCEVLFTAHSLPQRILQAGDPYPDQLAETAAALAERSGIEVVVRRLAERRAHRGPVDRARRPRGRCATGREAGTRAIVVCPCGFVADHLEILYDLDIETRALADELGVAFARTASPNARAGVHGDARRRRAGGEPPGRRDPRRVSRRVVIVGGGIAGLAAAHALSVVGGRPAGHPARALRARRRPHPHRCRSAASRSTSVPTRC